MEQKSVRDCCKNLSLLIVRNDQNREIIIVSNYYPVIVPCMAAITQLIYYARKVLYRERIEIIVIPYRLRSRSQANSINLTLKLYCHLPRMTPNSAIGTFIFGSIEELHYDF